MRQPLVSIILLATVTISSSNPLPPDNFETDLGLYRHYDNIFSNKFNTRNIFYSIFCKQRNQQNDIVERCKYLQTAGRAENDNNHGFADDYNDNERDEDDNYNGEGFRKEQWHNYPRRLDRLQTYPYDRHKAAYMKRTPEVVNYEGPPNREATSKDIASNEYILASNDVKTVYNDLITSTNPLLILKIRLAGMNIQIPNRNNTNFLVYRSENEGDVDEEELLEDNLNSDINLLEEKRNDPALHDIDETEDISPSDTEYLPVEKRLFSLWSRLQSLSHEQGHELHHRRHLHAIYGHPGLGLGGDMGLTAETRAALMRPPGSPLRWG